MTMNAKKQGTEYRTNYMHMRDRILYCRSFLRLAGKTQVYGTNFDDHTRNRLTHSLEVAQIARTIATGLNKLKNQELDIDEVEAIALGHDLGHTPFGHAGERQLHEILSYHNTNINEILFPKNKIKEDISEFKRINSGFKHNWQSVRILKFLCREYPGGYMFADIENQKQVIEVLKGILCHSSLCNGEKLKKGPLSFYDMSMNSTNYFSLDVKWDLQKTDIKVVEKIVNLADEIAQRHHDIEDAIAFHYLDTRGALEIIFGDRKNKDGSGPDIPTDFMEKKKDLQDFVDNEDVFLKKLSSVIVNYLVGNLVKGYTGETLQFDSNGQKVNEGMQIRMSDVILNSQNVQRMDSRGKFIIRKLFEAYADNPLQMPNNTLNAVFREYFRQQLWEASGMQNLLPDSNVRHQITQVLNSKNGINIFKHAHESREIFEKSYQLDNVASVSLVYKDDYYTELDKFNSVEKAKVVVINKPWFRICLMRVIADYISGMTDFYAENEYRKLYGMTHAIMA